MKRTPSPKSLLRSTQGMLLALLCAASGPLVGQSQEPQVEPPTVESRLHPNPLADAELVTPYGIAPAPPAGPAVYAPYGAAWDACAPPATCSACARPHAGADRCRCHQSPISRWWNGSMKPCLQESHWGYCNYFDDRPFGASLRQTISTQVAEGVRSQLVLYQYDFYAGGTPRGVELNERGREQLDRFADLMAATGLPLVVEQTPGQPQLSLQRRSHVAQLLQQRGLPPSEDYVLLRPVRSGLSSPEALLIYNNLLQQIGQGGMTMNTTSSQPPAP